MIDMDSFVQAVNVVSVSMHQAVLPTWLESVQTAATVLAVLVAAGAAVAAWKSASAASEAAHATRDATKYERLRDLMREFDERAYFVRFWRLHQVTKNKAYMSVSRDYGRNDLHEAKREIWLDALSMNPSTLRADMYALHNFALRLNSWLSPPETEAMSPGDVSYVNDLFGPHLVGTFLNHRDFACRLKPPDDRSSDYYVRYYGVSDPIYTRTLDALLQDLLDRDRLHSGQRGLFPRKNDEIKTHVESLAASKGVPGHAEQVVQPDKASL